MGKGYPDWMRKVGIGKDVPYELKNSYDNFSLDNGDPIHDISLTGDRGILQEISMGIIGTNEWYNMATIYLYRDEQTVEYASYYLYNILSSLALNKNIQFISDYFSVFHNDLAMFEIIMRININARFENGFKIRYSWPGSSGSVEFRSWTTWLQEIT